MLKHAYDIGLWIGLGWALPLIGQEPSPPPLKPDSPTNAPLRQISANVFEIGGVRFDKILKTVTFPACVNMKEGLVEYLLVSRNGKLHESVFRTDIEPTHLHIAMLFIGAKGAPDERSDEKRSPDATGSFYAGIKDTAGPPPPQLPPPKGDLVTIRLNWQEPKSARQLRAETCIWNQKSNAPMNDGYWVYTGSRIVNGAFLAQRDRSIVSIIPDTAALIANPRPDRQYDEIWHANASILPPAGTPVQVTITLERNRLRTE